jgi:hypothetical protein
MISFPSWLSCWLTCMPAFTSTTTRHRHLHPCRPCQRHPPREFCRSFIAAAGLRIRHGCFDMPLFSSAASFHRKHNPRRISTPCRQCSVVDFLTMFFFLLLFLLSQVLAKGAQSGRALCSRAHLGGDARGCPQHGHKEGPSSHADERRQCRPFLMA